MNNLTQITLLIAVIALALWPIVFFLLRMLHERRMKMEHIEHLTQEELDDISTKELVTSTLKKIGCQPAEDEDGNIRFKYQGDDFYIAAEEENRFIMIWNPWWGSISADNEALPYLKEIINVANINSLVTTVTMVDEDEKTVGIHSHCHTFFAPAEGELDEHLKMLLDFFFDAHNAIKENLSQLGAAADQAEVQKERVKVKGFAAYKENTVDIEEQQKEQQKEQQSEGKEAKEGKKAEKPASKGRSKGIDFDQPPKKEESKAEKPEKEAVKEEAKQERPLKKEVLCANVLYSFAHNNEYIIFL